MTHMYARPLNRVSQVLTGGVGTSAILVGISTPLRWCNRLDQWSEWLACQDESLDGHSVRAWSRGCKLHAPVLKFRQRSQQP